MGERKPLPPHWYFTTAYECPVCWKHDEHRERRYNKKPEDPAERFEFISNYCGCLV